MSLYTIDRLNIIDGNVFGLVTFVVVSRKRLIVPAQIQTRLSTAACQCQELDKLDIPTSASFNGP